MEQIWKLMLISKGNFVNGIHGGGKDSGGGGILPDGSIQVFGGTDNAGVFNDHHSSSDLGKTFAVLANAPWVASNEMAYVCKDGKIRIWGGVKADGTVPLHSYEYDAVNGWQLITAAMTGFGANRKIFSFEEVNGSYLTIGGGQNDIIKSTDLIAWNQIAMLPAEFQGLAASSASRSEDDLIIIAGGVVSGVHPGKLLQFDPVTLEFTEISSDPIFVDEWPTIVCLNGCWLYVRGTNGVSNNAGCYVSFDKGLTWQRLNYEHYPTHAPTVIPFLDRSGCYLVQGNDFTGSVWQFKRIDVSA